MLLDSSRIQRYFTLHILFKNPCRTSLPENSIEHDLTFYRKISTPVSPILLTLLCISIFYFLNSWEHQRRLAYHMLLFLALDYIDSPNGIFWFKKLQSLFSEDTLFPEYYHTLKFCHQIWTQHPKLC